MNMCIHFTMRTSNRARCKVPTPWQADCLQLCSLVQAAADASFASVTIDRPDARCLCVFCVRLCVSLSLSLSLSVRARASGGD
jgi:hypothetical protein